MHLKPIAKRLIARQSVAKYQGAIALPDGQESASATCIVTARGNKIHPSLQPGTKVVIENGFEERLKFINDEKDFVCQESNVIGILLRDQLFPLDNWILFERDTNEKVSGSGIVTSVAIYQYQSMMGWIRNFGLLRPGVKRKFSYEKGAYCQLATWEPHMKEFLYMDKRHVLIKASDLLCHHA